MRDRALSIRPSASSLRWLALFVLMAGIVFPDCCLNGSHAFGRGMDAFGAICRARS
jgi:hypothetical protein